MKLFRNLFQTLKPQRKRDLFVANLLLQARWCVKCAQELRYYLEEPSKEKILSIKQIEREADQVRREMIKRLNRTFVTPIDREDLFGLSRALDNVIDHTYSMTREMHMLRVKPDRYTQRMARLLLEVTQELYRAIQNLEHSPTQSDQHAIRVRRLENKMNKLYSRALSDLFKSDQTQSMQDVVNMIKLREIYWHMYQAIGSAEQAANRISDVVIKFY